MTFIKGLQHFALLIARLGLGGVMLAHAWQRWQITGVDRQIAYLTQHGVPGATWIAWGTIIGEAVGGLFLVVGLLTPLVGLGLLIEQILIISWVRWYRGIYDSSGGFEYQVVIGVLSLIFIAFGAGRVSLDRLFRRGRKDGDRARADDRVTA